MTRSRRHTPIVGIGGKSEKFDKVLGHKKMRRASKTLLQNIGIDNLDEADNLMFPVVDEVMNKWDMQKDGKMYISPNSDWYKKAMRK